jgi:hypothetical protein
MRIKDDELRFREAVEALGAVTVADMHTAAEMAGTKPKSISMFIRRLAGRPLAIEPEIDREPELSLPSIDAVEADTELEEFDGGEL